MSQQEINLKCLEMAKELHQGQQHLKLPTPDGIIETAKKLKDFIKKG